MSCKGNADENKHLISEESKQTRTEIQSDSLKIIPISHATMILTHNDNMIYIDPIGGANIFAEYAKPSFVLVTDIHGDHMDKETLQALDLSNAYLIVPKAVADQLPELKTKESKAVSSCK